MAVPARAADIAGEPEYAGIFAERDAKGHYTQLERVTPVPVTRVRAFGFGGGETHLQITGEASAVRFKAGQQMEFVVRVLTQEKDPATLVQFYTLTPSKGNRILQMANVGGMGLHAEQTSGAHAVSFSATKLGTKFFRVVSAAPLPPGEYMVGTSDAADGFCFGIDP